MTQLAADLGSFWELLAVVGIIALPTIPITYFLWGSIVSGRDERTREVTSGRSSGAAALALSAGVSTSSLDVAMTPWRDSFGQVPGASRLSVAQFRGLDNPSPLLASY